MSKETYDFSGWATRNNIRCSDGRTIRKNAFQADNGETVPLVYNHDHKDPEKVIGHALLENREDGVYAYCSLNNSRLGQIAKEQVTHGDITALSIYANQLKQNGSDVIHGKIREVSLVLAGANPGAFIDSVIVHGDGEEEEAKIFHNYVGDGTDIEICHADENTNDKGESGMKDTNIKHADANTVNESSAPAENEKTYGDVYETLNEEQKDFVEVLVGYAVEKAMADAQVKHSDNMEDNNMSYNLFENNNTVKQDGTALTHADIDAALQDAKKYGSMKDSFLAHGITNIDYLYPDYKNITDKPGFINTNPIGWVSKIMAGVHHTPFARIKMMFADITGEDARAKGFVKGNEKTDEVFSLLKRVVDPTTVYKKQSFDRDDIVDITDFDVIPWVKAEMRMKLDEELARAFIFGDGRSNSSNDKIKEDKIIPVIKDTTENLYAMVYNITPAEGESVYSAFIDQVVLAFNNYEGSGNTTLFASSESVAKMLLLKDLNGHRIYKDIKELATAMTVNDIVKIPAALLPSGFVGVILDLADYNVGADKGGAVNLFDDFDIDYNKEKYLIETRCSGALIKPHSAIVLKYTAPEVNG